MSRTATSGVTEGIKRRYSSQRVLESQRRFIDWIVALFGRADAQGISLEPLTDFEVEWIGRVL